MYGKSLLIASVNLSVTLNSVFSLFESYAVCCGFDKIIAVFIALFFQFLEMFTVNTQYA